MQDDSIKAQWHKMLGGMLKEYREGNPDDTRTDQEILTSLMDSFVEQGLIKKVNGKYILSEIRHDA